ncbi:MAG: hypothetical protein F6K56_35375 [Moorea sp. SIO3G5]|nr:hypothetical protein [Moorena sp. SIO3G5]
MIKDYSLLMQSAIEVNSLWPTASLSVMKLIFITSVIKFFCTGVRSQLSISIFIILFASIIIPCSLFPIPYSLFPVPCSLFPAL